jgi:succinyldiaminopimelate transaminase
MKEYPMEVLLKKREEVRKKGLKVYDFSTGDVNEQVPEFIRKALTETVEKEVIRYPSVRGKKELREVISNWLKKRFGVSLDPETQIIPTSGSKEAIFHFPLVFLKEKKRVIYGTPGYPVYERGTIYAGGIPTPVVLREEENFLLRLDKLPKGLLEETKIVWINYPHNPTGATASLSYLEETYHICREYEIILCSDECYSEIYYEKPQPSILQVGIKGVVAFHSLSKRSGMTGYRSGFVAGDSEIVLTYARERANFGVASPEFVQACAIKAWSDENHVEERRRSYREKAKLFLDLFASLGLKFRKPEGTFYLWIKVPEGLTDISYAELLLEKGIVVSPGSFFGKGGENFIRVALVPSLKDCEEAVKIWRKAHAEIEKK